MSSPQTKKAPFMSQVSGHFANNDLYSDITLRIDDVEISAHRVVLASQSTWFAQMLLDANRQDHTTKPPTLIIPAPHDTGDLLITLITYMYTRFYPALIPAGSPCEPASRTCLRHLRLYMVASAYGVPAVQAAAARRVKNYLTQVELREDVVNVAVAAELVPFVFGDALKPLPLSEERDAHGLRKFLVERVVEAKVEGEVLARWVETCPGFGVEYIKACWNVRARQIEEKTLQAVFCAGCGYGMEIAVTSKAGQDSASGSEQPSCESGASVDVTLAENGPEQAHDPIRCCPNCKETLLKQQTV